MTITTDVQVVQHDLPDSILPDLEEYGIESVQKGICEDTYENRQILRENKLRWRDLFEDDGTPSNRILVVSPEMQKAITLRKADILDDPRDQDADYKTGTLLLLTENVEAMVPAWVLAATRHWLDIERKRETDPHYFKYVLQPPGRCRASRPDGHRCRNWFNGSRSDGELCRMHLGRPGTPQINSIQKARNKSYQIASRAMDELEALMDSATSEPVRLKAAEAILDRVGIRAGVEIDQHVNIEVRPARDMIENKLNRLAVDKSSPVSQESDEIVDAEVVEDSDHE